MSNTRQTSIKKISKYALIGSIVGLVLFIADLIVFTVLYANDHQDKYLFIGFTVGTILLFLIIALAIVVPLYIYKHFYQNIFSVTSKNLKHLTSQSKGLGSYGDERNAIEFAELNEMVALLNKQLDQTIITNGDIDYSNMELKFVGEEKDFITFESFKEHIFDLINRAEYFRNAFVSVSYPLQKEFLTEEERQNVLTHVRDIISYPNVLIVDNRPKNEFFLFVPRFDSIDRLKEDIDALIRTISLSRTTSLGIRAIAARASMVVYPYSNDDQIIEDLRHAARQGKQINVYLPKKRKQSLEKYSQSSRNINNISRILERLASINNNTDSMDKVAEQARVVFRSISDYYGFDASGFYTYEEFNNKFRPIISTCKEEAKSFATLGSIVTNEFAADLFKIKDDDSSYYFSSRKRLSPKLGEYLDVYGVESGYFFLVLRKKKINGVFYFAKKDEMALDSYLRDSLLSFCHSFGNITDAILANRTLDSTTSTLNGILKLTNYCLYSIDRDTLTVHSYSDTMKTIAPKIKEHVKCYEAIFGEKTKCAKCPLHTGRRMFQEIGKNRYEVSTVLSEPNSKEIKLLLCPAPKQGEVLTDRFDPELLVDSFYSLMETMKVNFTTNQKGTLLILNIDNGFDLIGKYNTDDYNAWLRQFILALRGLSVSVANIYSISNRVLALNIPDMTRNDMISYVEKAYELSKKKFLDVAADSTLEITYTLYSYPSGYQNADEYMRNLLHVSQTPTKYLRKEMLFVPEVKYQRPASHKEFILDILSNSLNKNTFDVMLQPVLTKNGKIDSAEMLLRLSDSFLGNVVNTFEVIQAASESKKIALITDILIDYLGNTITQYGQKLFRKFDVLRLSLNTDYTFFEDLDFIKKINELKIKLNLQDDFIVFEIRENEIAKNYANFTTIIKTLVRNKINLVCDNYTGIDLSIERLKAIGFTGVKIDRSIVMKIADDQSSLEYVRSIAETAEHNNLKVTLVGVETKEQDNVLKTIPYSFDVQGYYYYKPLDIPHFINELLRQK